MSLRRFSQRDLQFCRMAALDRVQRTGATLCPILDVFIKRLFAELKPSDGLLRVSLTFDGITTESIPFEERDYFSVFAAFSVFSAGSVGSAGCVGSTSSRQLFRFDKTLAVIRVHLLGQPP